MQGLHHIEIYVANLGESKGFWSYLLNKLGYHKFQEWEQGVSWKLENCYLVFVQTEERFLKPEYHRCQTGLNHLAFHSKSREQVDEIYKKLKKRGTKILYENKHPFAGGENHYALYFEDPNRIKVELVAPL